MGFYVDIAELQKAQEAYMKMVATAQSQLDTAKNGMNAIITSNSMHGEVGKSITNEINNVHNPVIVGLKNGLEFLGSEFSKTITDFQNLVGETSATAVLAKETLDDAVKTLMLAMRIRLLIVLKRQGKPSGIKLPIWMPMMQEA